MDVQQHDKTFVATFLAILGFLGAFTVAILIIANVVSAKTDNEAEAEAQARMQERIKPVGQVITDEKMLLAAAPPAATQREPMSGKDVAAKVCGACHNTGILDAPKSGDKAAWAARGNLAALTASAIKGKGAMPPRGGDPSLSDDEIKAAIQEMAK